MHHSLSSFAAFYLWHRHNLHHQARPPTKMLRSLSSTRLGIILFPSEACSFPLIEHVFHQICAESGIDFAGLGFVGPRLDCDVLEIVN